MEYKNAEIVFIKLMDSEKYSGQFVKVELKPVDEEVERNHVVFLSQLMPGGKPNKYFGGSKLEQLLTATNTLEAVEDEFRGSKITDNKSLMKLVNLLKGKIVELSINDGKVMSINPALEKKAVPKAAPKQPVTTGKTKAPAEIRPQLQDDSFDWGDING